MAKLFIFAPSMENQAPMRCLDKAQTTPHTLWHKVNNNISRGCHMKNDNRLASGSLILLLPASLLISSSILGFNVPEMLIQPFFVVGGVLGALALNLLAILRVGAER